MKIIYTFFLAITCFFTASAQNNNKNTKTSQTQLKQSTEVKQEVATSLGSSSKPSAATAETISFNENEFDFSKIPQGKPVTHVFLFKNISNKPIALENVQASCGCTTPEWSKDSVAPGQTSQITVGYNAANEGSFTKFITVTYNGAQSKQINIKGEVWKTPETSAPENSALGTLKDQQ